MVIKVKKNNDKFKKNTFYVDKEILDIMKLFYQIKRNLIILSVFSKTRIDTELKFSA